MKGRKDKEKERKRREERTRRKKGKERKEGQGEGRETLCLTRPRCPWQESYYILFKRLSRKVDSPILPQALLPRFKYEDRGCIFKHHDHKYVCVYIRM